MPQAYVADGPDKPPFHSTASPQVIYEALVGRRGFHQRRDLFGPRVPCYALDRTLASGRVVSISVQPQGDIAWATMTVRLADGTYRAVTLKLDRREPRPIVSAAVL